MGDSLEAAVVSFSTGLLFVTAIALFRKDVRTGFVQIFKAVKESKMPPWTLAAGALGASFVAMQTYVVPIAGVALFTVGSLAGQTGISLWVDKLALSGGAKTLITKRRVIAAVITVFAVGVSAWDRRDPAMRTTTARSARPRHRCPPARRSAHTTGTGRRARSVAAGTSPRRAEHRHRRDVAHGRWRQDRRRLGTRTRTALRPAHRNDAPHDRVDQPSVG